MRFLLIALAASCWAADLSIDRGALVLRGNSLTALQFDIESEADVIVVPGPAIRQSNKVLRVAGKRVIIFGYNQLPIPEGIALATLRANAPATLRIVAPVGVNAEGSTISIDAYSGEAVSSLSVYNAATLENGPVAPGEIVTVLGTNGAESVLFDGVAAPLLYVGANQINAVAPYALANRRTTRVQVGQAIQELEVTPTSPGIFTIFSNGLGQAAMLRQGSIITFFATGAGQTDPPGVDGKVSESPLPAPLERVSVRIGGMEAEVLYAGAAPGMISGVLQVNCRVPAGVTPGFAVPLELQVGAATSPKGVTVTID